MTQELVQHWARDQSFFPSAPEEVPEVLDALPRDPEIVDLERRHGQLYRQIRYSYHFVKRALQKIRKKYDDLTKELNNARKNLKDEIYKAFRKDYFCYTHNKVLEKQLVKDMTDKNEDVESVVERRLEERIRV
jgi:hypothetical protein